jgi:hypothetical protein
MHIDDQRWRVALTEPEARELGSSGPVWPGATDWIGAYRRYSGTP